MRVGVALFSQFVASPAHRQMRYRTVACAALVIALPSCSTGSIIDRMWTPASDAKARSFVEHLYRGQVDSVLEQLSPQLSAIPGIRDSIAAVIGILPGGSDPILELANAEVGYLSGATHRRAEYQLLTNDAQALFTIEIREADSGVDIQAFRIQPLSARLQDIHDFRLFSRSATHWIVLFVTVAAAAFSAGVAVLAGLTPMRRRWLWVLLALIGVGQATFHWSAGTITYSMISVQLFSAGFRRIGLLGPWFLTFSFPLGALLALRQRRRWQFEQQLSTGSPPSPSPVESKATTSVHS